MSGRLHARGKSSRSRVGASRRPAGKAAAKGTRPPGKGAAKGTRRPGGKAVARAGTARTRNRVPVLLAAAIALVVIGTSFPFTDLLHQRQQLSAEAAQLAQLRHQNGLLAKQEQQLSTSAEIERLARQNYQLVPPGKTLYDILPPSGKTSVALAGQPSAGDPADQPLVSPADAPNMTPDPGLPQAQQTGSPATGGTAAAGTAAPRSASSFWGRVTSTLEFWK